MKDANQHPDQQDRTIDYPSPLSTASQLCGDLARRWLGDCMRNHTKCSERYVDSDQLPTRLIDVGPLDGTNEPRIVLSCELQGFRDVRYVTLSHRWPSDPVAKLESTNLESLRRCIPLKSLPRTFVDAIEVTRALSVRYLWIDSLCIFQDSIDDWQAQATEMGKVYQNGLCNLAATGAATATGGANTDGLFQERDSHSVTPSKIRIRFKGHDSTYTAVPQELWGQWISTSTLNRRGWVFQERMLSPRTLHFSSQLFWECREMQACETYPYGLPAAAEKSTEETTRYYTESDGFKLPVTFKNWRGTCAQDGKGYWCKVVESYGRCFITRPEDRLVAIAGTARLLQPLLDDDYIAGLWKKDLPWNLPWLLFNVVGYVERPAGYRCTSRAPPLLQFRIANVECTDIAHIGPSWSWAALDYGSALISDQLVRESDRVRSLVLIQSAHIEPLGSDLYGLLNGGYLELKGQVAQISTARNIDRQGIWIDGGQYSVACYHDLPGSEGYDLVREGSLFCMPLLLRNQDGATIADCLLLRQISPHKQDYTRFGILKVSLDLEYALPEEFLWIVKFARSELPLEYCVTVTIY